MTPASPKKRAVELCAGIPRLGAQARAMVEAMRHGSYATLSAKLEARPPALRLPESSTMYPRVYHHFPSFERSPEHFTVAVDGRPFPVSALRTLARHGMVEPTARRWRVRARWRLIGTPEGLVAHVSRILAATTPADVEEELQAARASFRYRGLGESAPERVIRRAMVLRGDELATKRPRGWLLPRFESRTRALVVGDVSLKVGRGQNSAGTRYAWAAAEKQVMAEWARHRFTGMWAKAAWSWWELGFPHRALEAIETAKGIRRARRARGASK